MNFLKYSLLSASLMLVTNAVTRAEVIEVVDMSKITCKQMMAGTPDAIEAAVWMSGYYHGLRKNTKLNMIALKYNGELVLAACKDNPDKTVMRTVDTLTGGGKMK